jgi:hypothetical protein
MSGPWIAAIVAQWVVIVLLAAVQIGTLRRVLPIIESAAVGLARAPVVLAGTALPEFEATLLDGTIVTAGQLVGRPFVLLFVSQGCRPCERLLRQLADGAFVAGDVPVHLVVDRDRREGLPVPNGVTPLLEREDAVSRALQVDVTPLAVSVDGGGVVIESMVPGGPGDLERLIRALGRHRAPVSSAGRPGFDGPARRSLPQAKERA